jgi:hypothetical protein
MISPFNGRSIEFFEGGDGRLSMTRLLMYLSFWPAAYIACADRGSETYGWFISAYVFGYLGGKGADALARIGPKSIINNAEVANVAVDKPE